jgi:hypothetical protein
MFAVIELRSGQQLSILAQSGESVVKECLGTYVEHDVHGWGGSKERPAFLFEARLCELNCKCWKTEKKGIQLCWMVGLWVND